MVTAYQSGYKIYYTKKHGWRYCDTKEPVNKDALRPCKKCGKKIIAGLPDPCLGYLEGVKAACCGHGIESQSYIMYESEENHEL